jgi:thiamine-phosphate pyrophosphorylase
VVISEEYGMGRPAIEIAKEAVSGGADILQLREKGKPAEEIVMTGKEIAAICKAGGRIFIVNDDPLIARRIGADGVHLGQEDIKRFPIKTARSTVGQGGIIGVSTHSLEQFEKANEEDVDYIAFGPIFPTKTKDYAIGTADIEDVMRLAKRPVFFIGGITIANMDEILNRGGRNVALIRGVSEAADMAKAARGFKEMLCEGKERLRI